MPRPPNPKSKSNQIVLKGRDERESIVINAVKEVCARDGLELNREGIKLWESWLKQHNYPPGNPQAVLNNFDGTKKSRGLCEWEGCPNEATCLCYSAFPYGKDKRYCNRHRMDAERKRDIRSWKNL